MREAEATCKVTSSSIDPCPILDECIEDRSSGQRMRLTLEDVVNIGKSIPVRIGQLLVIRAGGHRKQGVCINYCPFCGTDLAPARSRVGAREKE